MHDYNNLKYHLNVFRNQADQNLPQVKRAELIKEIFKPKIIGYDNSVPIYNDEIYLRYFYSDENNKRYFIGKGHDYIGQASYGTNKWDIVCKSLNDLGTYMFTPNNEEKKKADAEKKKNKKLNIATQEEQHQIINGYKENRNKKKEYSRPDTYDTDSKKFPYRKPKFKVHNIDIKKSDKRYFHLPMQILGKENSKISKFINAPKNLKINEKQNTSTSHYETREYSENLMSEQLHHNGQFRSKLSKMDKNVGKKFGTDYKSDAIETKLAKVGFIKFKMPDRHGEPISFFDDRLGFYDESIDKLKMTFSNPEFVKGIIYAYPEIVDYEDRIESDLYHILNVFKECFGKADLKPYEIDAFKWFALENRPIHTEKDDDVDVKTYGRYEEVETVHQLLKSVHGKNFTSRYTYKILSEIIPKKVCKVFDEWYEDWYYMFVEKGEYKKCKKCEQVKLVNKFVSAGTGKYLRGECKDCYF